MFRKRNIKKSVYMQDATLIILYKFIRSISSARFIYCLLIFNYSTTTKKLYRDKESLILLMIVKKS